MTPGRFVLLLDILGFKEILKAQSAEQVCAIVEDVLKECDSWTSGEHNDFDTIHFSDTIVLHGRREGAYHDWYTDLTFVGARVCNRLLSQGIPVRGAMGFGEFLTKKSGRHHVFLGQALVDAYTAQERKPFLGFSVPPYIWRGMYPKPGVEKYLTAAGKGVRLRDDSFWINPLTEFDDRDEAGRLEYSITEAFHGREGSGYLKGELRAFRFIVDEAARLSDTPGTPPRVVKKYTNTLGYLRRTLGKEFYELAETLSAKLDEMPPSSR